MHNHHGSCFWWYDYCFTITELTSSLVWHPARVHGHYFLLAIAIFFLDFLPLYLLFKFFHACLTGTMMYDVLMLGTVFFYINLKKKDAQDYQQVYAYSYFQNKQKILFGETCHVTFCWNIITLKGFLSLLISRWLFNTKFYKNT